MPAASIASLPVPSRVLMLLENQPYPRDVRVRLEALSLTRAGYQVKVVAPRGDGEPARETVDGVEVERFRLPPVGESALSFVLEYAVANIQLYARGLRDLGRVDVVHLHNPPDTLFPVGWVARALGRRVVFDHHDIAPELFAEKFQGRGGLLVRLLRLLERLSRRVGHVVLEVNESLRDAAISRGKPAGDVFVVRNAPPRAMLGEARPPRPGRLAEPQLVFVGAMELQDNVDALPELLTMLRERHGLAPRLTVAGDGTRLAPVQRAMREAGHEDRVTFTGRVPHAQVARLIAEADICVEPADCNELNHLCSMAKVYDYMAAGRPIVGFPLREVMRLGGDGILYADCGDLAGLAAHIHRLAEDGQLRVELGQRLQDRALEFTWERSEEALLSAYGRLSNGGPPRT